MSTVCRCCLVEGTFMKNLFSFRIKCKNGEEDVSFADAYNLNTNLNIRKDSKQPMDICLNCEEKLIASYRFRIQCRETNEVLSKLNVSETEEDFWDDEFLYNVPSLTKGDFFTVKSPEIKIQCAYELCSVVMDTKTHHEITARITDSNELTEDIKRTNFTCSKCEKRFVVHSFYRVHCEKLHSSDWECEYCEERFTAKTYGEHKRLHTNRPLFECYRCNTIFMSRTHLTRHRCPVPDPVFESPSLTYAETETEEENFECKSGKKSFFKCTECQEQFSVHSFYRVHCEKFHNSDWECEVCDERFTGETYGGHKLIHRQPHKCNRCNKMFVAKHSLKKHRCSVSVVKIDVNEEPAVKVEIEVEIPQESLSDAEIFVDDSGQFVEKASSKGSLSQQIRKYQCLVCNDEFTTKSKFSAHKKIHKGKSEEALALSKTYLCNYCGKSCKTYNSWVGHIRIHTGEKPYNCDICGKNFRQTTSLRNHRQLHTGKKVMCDLCPKTFASTGFLAVHMRSHNNERNFKCEICDKSYLMKHALAEHIRVKHKLVRYSCSYCDNSFTSQGERKIHETIHTGKRWWCPECSYRATTRNTLKGHLSNVHKLSIDDLNIEAQETGFELKIDQK